MNAIDKLSQLFGELPGIGPRQAKRFVYYLLGQSRSFRAELKRAIERLENEVEQCARCYRIFQNESAKLQKLCEDCGDKHRDSTTLMIVEKDVDLDVIRRTEQFRGYYFVLGGLIPILEKNPAEKVRLKELDRRVRENGELKEIIVAVSASPMGDHTVEFLREYLLRTGVKVSTLGRGLSTGTELEYSDAETLKSALQNRS